MSHCWPKYMFTEALEGFLGYMDIGQKLKGIKDIFVNILRDTGYLDQF